MKAQSALSLLSVMLAASIVATKASASPTFPDAIQAARPNMPCVPQCVLCHTTNLGGYGTAVTPFAAAMVSKGKLRPAHTETVGPALKALDTLRIDSDSDGIPDVEELDQGTNPNGDSVALCSDVGYGCVRVAPHGRPTTSVIAAALVALIWGARRRGRHR